MRGKPQAQPEFLTVVNLNASVPPEHPLRAIKLRLDAVLKKLSPLFDELYAELGRPSIPPEQLLKARVLTALYTVLERTPPVRAAWLQSALALVSRPRAGRGQLRPQHLRQELRPRAQCRRGQALLRRSL